METTNAPDPAQQEQAQQAQQALQTQIQEIANTIKAQGDRSGELGEQLSTLQQQLGYVQQFLSQSARPAQEPTRTEPSEEFKKLYSDIPGYIREQAKREALEVLKSTVGPHLRLQAEQTKTSIIEAQRGRVDSLFGPGTWEATFAEDVSNTLSELPLEMQASSQHVEAAVQAILGRKYLTPDGRKDLEERAAKFRKEQADAAEGGVLPNGRPRPPRGDTLDENQLAFLSSLQRSGFKMSEADYKRAANSGRTYQEWKAAKGAVSKK